MKYFIIALISILILAISWVTTAGIIWLICLCFDWAFSLLIATGVWLVMLLLSSTFKSSK